LREHTPIAADARGRLPFGCDKTGFGFVDARTGWVTGDCAGGLAFFYVTHDAGRHWQLQRLFDVGTAECNVYPPHFFGRSTGVVEVTCFERSGWHARLFRTDDGGSTWRQRRVPVADAVSFAGADDLWTGTHHELFVSHDGGASWHMLTAPFDVSVYELDPISGRTAFAVRTAPRRTSLLRSDDGGRTWRAVSSRRES
jgi:photosystem II stability/assembly factor-like uncharacterized protein